MVFKREKHGKNNGRLGIPGYGFEALTYPIVKSLLVDDFLFCQVGYASSLEGNARYM